MREYLIICLLTLFIVGSMIAFTQIALTYAPDNGVYALKDWAYYWWTK